MTRRLLARLGLAVLLVLTGCRGLGSNRSGSGNDQGPVCAVYFSPHGGCTEHVVQAIRSARTSIFVQAYSFTSQPITHALIDAYRRGVKVDVILDKSQEHERHSTAEWLARSGVPVEVDAVHAIAHNKVMVIDGQTVLTGSFNFTEAAEQRNAENLLVVQDPTLAAQYAANWQAHRVHATPYAGPRGETRQPTR